MVAERNPQSTSYLDMTLDVQCTQKFILLLLLIIYIYPFFVVLTVIHSVPYCIAYV